MKIPSNKLWTQLNEGEVTGALNETKNIALDTVGQAKLAKRPVALMSSASNADFGYPMSIVYFDNQYTVVTADNVFQGTLNGSTFLEEATFTPSTTLASDALTFTDATTTQLIVTTGTNFARWNGGGSVSYTLGTLTADVPHPLCIFDSNPTYKLAIGNGNLVHTYDTSYNLNSTILTLSSQFIVTTMRYRNGYLYIGTKTTDGTEARIFIWNGTGTNAQYECPVGCEWVFAMTEYGSSVAAIVSSGELIQISGSEYVQLAALPVFYDPHAKWQGSSGFQLNGRVFNRGIGTVGKNIYLNIDARLDTGFSPAMKSGLWVFDPSVGLYHRASSSTDELVNDSSFTFSGETITTSAAHSLKTGDAVQIVNISGITGIDADFPYYVTVVTPTTIKISMSRKGVANSNYITLGGIKAAEKLVYFPNLDSGQHTANSSGALAITSINETPIETLTGEVIWGCSAANFESVSTYVLNGFHDSNNTGHITTQRIYTDNIEQSWKSLSTFLDGIVTESDEIVVKIQTQLPNKPLEIRGAWLNANTINSNNSDEFLACADFEVGDEIVFTKGYGQGKTAHITEINASSGTYSLVLDEDIGTINEIGYFYATTFKKIGTYGINNKEKEIIPVSLLEYSKSPWIKIKLEMRGANTYINMLELSNAIHKGAN